MNVTQITTVYIERYGDKEKTYHNGHRFSPVEDEDSNAPVKKMVLHIDDKRRVEVILDSRPFEEIDNDARPTTE